MKRYYLLSALLLLFAISAVSTNLEEPKQTRITTTTISSGTTVNTPNSEPYISYSLYPIDWEHIDLYYQAFTETTELKNWNGSFYQNTTRLDAYNLWINESTAFFAVFDSFFFQGILMQFNGICIEGNKSEALEFYNYLISISSNYGISYHIETMEWNQ